MKERIQRFLTYELWYTVAAVFAAAAVCFMVWHYFHKAPEPLLYAAVFDVTLLPEEETRMKGTLADMLRNDKSVEVTPERITLDDRFRSDNAKDLERFQVLLFNHAVDMVIADEEVIRTMAAFGYFQDVRNVVSSETEKELLFETAGYRDSEEISMEDHETGQGDVLPYAYRLSKSRLWKNLSEQETPGFLAAAVLETPNKKTVSVLFSLLAEEENNGDREGIVSTGASDKRSADEGI